MGKMGKIKKNGKNMINVLVFRKIYGNLRVFFGFMKGNILGVDFRGWGRGFGGFGFMAFFGLGCFCDLKMGSF